LGIEIIQQIKIKIMESGTILLIITLIVIVILIATAKKSVRQTPGIFLELIINKIKIGGTITMVSIKDTQKVSGQLKPKDSKGNATTVQAGSVNYDSTDANVCTVVKDPDDETKFTVTAGAPGVAQVNFTADADLGEGVVQVSGSLAVEVTAGQATTLGVELGEPVDQ
jgi:hypothetical protein